VGGKNRVQESHLVSAEEWCSREDTGRMESRVRNEPVFVSGRKGQVQGEDTETKSTPEGGERAGSEGLSRAEQKDREGRPGGFQI
jgi:hypothetical protein